MGEYIKTARGSIKLGTCEDLYYVTFDQLCELVNGGAEKQPGNLEPRDYLKESHGFRYRFPFPDEDGHQPGECDDFNRGVTVHAPAGWLEAANHDDLCHSCQPIGQLGYNINVLHPCPMSKDAGNLKMSRGPHSRLVQIIQHKQVDGVLWTVCRCAYCGSAFRLPLEDAITLADEITQHHAGDPFRLEIARRMLAGYRAPVAEMIKGAEAAINLAEGRQP